jgi:hypothetical protein
VYLKTGKSVPFSGPAINPPISCNKGLSILSIPSPPNGYTSYDLLSCLGSPDEITGLKRFNRGKGTFETTSYCFGQPSGARFDIVRGEAYFIQMKVARDKDGP